MTEDEFPEIPFDHCKGCGDPIFHPKRKWCNWCARSKFGED